VARILSGNAWKRVGAPGYRIVSLAGRGGQVAKDTASRVQTVRRLFAQDPKDGKTANIGTKRDVNIRFTNDPDVRNVTPAQNPRIINGSVGRRRSAKISGISLRNRSKNTNLRKY